MSTVRYLQVAAVVVWTMGSGSPVSAHTDHADNIEEITVYGRAQQLIGNVHAASEGMVSDDDIQLPPLLRVGELVEAIPGMVATQHSGTGKANQFFVRGFNLDHGTDLSIISEGVPVNMRTHGHGQGYLDLNFMIPELVETMTYRKGTYSAEVGDFSAAASAEFSYYEKLPEDIIMLTGGEHDYWRGLLAASTEVFGGTLTGALDATTYDGPWELPENLEQYKFYLSYAFDVGLGRATLGLQGYDGGWDSTDQIPQRAVREGLISDRGFIDPDLGGTSDRYAATASVAFQSWEANAYIVDYDFNLFSNFTYQLGNPTDGDQFEQRDDRTIYGGRVFGVVDHSLFSREANLRWGADVRFDEIREVALYDTLRRARTNTRRRDSVEQLSLGGYLELELALSERLRAVTGLRIDHFDWQVDALRPVNSGSGDDQQVSPKVSLSYRLSDSVEAYVSAGRGFHSNDVRGATITLDPASGDAVDPVPVFATADGAELGLRIERGREFNATLVGFWLELDSELVYVGDAGTTEPNDGTRRAGVEATVFWQLRDWLSLNAAYTYTDAEYDLPQGVDQEIPGAIESTFTFGVNGAWRNGLSLSARLRWLSEAPLTEDGSLRADDSLLVNAVASYRRGATELSLEVLNLLDSNDDDIAYFYASRLPGEPAAGVEDVHFHPLEPRSIRASIRYHF